MKFEEIDELLSQITAEIKRRQTAMLQLSSELQKLEFQARSLTETRALLVASRSAGDAYETTMRAKKSVSLKGEILKVLGSFSERDVNGGGVTLSDIAGLLRTTHYPNADSKSFYPNVYTTIRRLMEKGQIVELIGKDGRRLFKLAEKDSQSGTDGGVQ